MFRAADSPWLVPFDGSFRVAGAATAPPDGTPSEDDLEARLEDSVDRLRDLQRKLYAQDQIAVLLVFQAMDAGGKDSTIRHVMTGVNPAGCQVFSFKQPSREELDHDFLWRTAKCLPERGRIGIFNRSHYEEVLVVRVHPEFLQAQRLPDLPDDLGELWERRCGAIASWEKHLADAGTMILKFWLNVSREEQRERFLSRLDEPEKHWKFSLGDVRERQYWDGYMGAYQDALNRTSRPWAPWYAVPADDKDFMRMTVADIIVGNLEACDLAYPTLSDTARSELEEGRRALVAEAE
jgi:PPK2 family polyphosphate:nucleotide phosphotransferase